jgi:hypothetical protein
MNSDSNAPIKPDAPPNRNVIDFMELKGDIQVKFPKYDIFDLRK